MLKRGLIITSVILLIALLTYLNPNITSLGFFPFDKEDKIAYASDILDTKILNAQIISQNEIKTLVQNRENINLRFFIKVEGEQGIASYYDATLLEAKSTKYLSITFNKDKTGNFIKKINIIPYLQLENKKIVYKFSETSYQINRQTPTEETIQETSLDSEILTVPQQRETTYVYGNGLIASLDDQGNIQYYHKDNLGSVRAITDSNGDVIYSSSYEPFGTKFAEAGSSSYSYTGKQEDNTGLYYYGARYYDSNLGRFTQIDPVLSAEDSPYVYVKNNPLKYIDLNGEGQDSPRVYLAWGKAVNSALKANNPLSYITKSRENNIIQTKNIEKADIITIAGHNSGTYFYGGSNDPILAISDLPKSESVDVCVFSSCYTTTTSLSSLQRLKTLTERFENINLVLGHASRAPSWDTHLTSALGEVMAKYLEEGDYEGLANFWITEGQNILTSKSEGGDWYPKGKLGAYYKKDGKWYHVTATQPEPKEVLNQPPEETQESRGRL